MISDVESLADTAPISALSTAEMELVFGEGVSTARITLSARCVKADVDSARRVCKPGIERMLWLALFVLETACARPQRPLLDGLWGTVFRASVVSFAGRFAVLVFLVGFIFEDSEEISRVM